MKRLLNHNLNYGSGGIISLHPLAYHFFHPLSGCPLAVVNLSVCRPASRKAFTPNYSIVQTERKHKEFIMGKTQRPNKGR